MMRKVKYYMINCAMSSDQIKRMKYFQKEFFKGGKMEIDILSGLFDYWKIILIMSHLKKIKNRSIENYKNFKREANTNTSVPEMKNNHSILLGSAVNNIQFLKQC